MVNTDISVEELIYWIERATCEYDEDWQFHAWDTEYAQDSLNELLPGLGSYVSMLRRKQPLGTAEYYKRSLTALFDIVRSVKFDDEDFQKEIVTTFTEILELPYARI